MIHSPTEEKDHLVSDYVAAAAQHRRATREGNSALANRSDDVVAGIYRALREQGERERLLPLLADADPAVRGWAASHALEFAPERAVPVLAELAAGPPSSERLDAQMTLKEWKKGTLKFP